MRRATDAVSTALASVVVAVIFWVSRLADPTACHWANVTAGEDER